MLDTKRSAFDTTQDLPIAPGAGAIREGQVLVAVYQADGTLSVKPSTGGSSEVFVGVALAHLTDIDTTAVFESLTSGTPKTVELSHTPVSGSLALFGSTGTALTAVSSAANVDANTKYYVSGTTVTLNAASITVSVQYRRDITTKESRDIQGDVQPGTHITSERGVVGVITSGTVFTDEYDTTGRWHTGVVGIAPAAGGLFKPSTAATSVASLLLQIPLKAGDLLGLRLA